MAHTSNGKSECLICTTLDDSDSEAAPPPSRTTLASAAPVPSQHEAGLPPSQAVGSPSRPRQKADVPPPQASGSPSHSQLEAGVTSSQASGSAPGDRGITDAINNRRPTKRCVQLLWGRAGQHMGIARFGKVAPEVDKRAVKEAKRRRQQRAAPHLSEAEQTSAARTAKQNCDALVLGYISDRMHWDLFRFSMRIHRPVR